MKYILALFFICLASPSYAQQQGFNPNALKVTPTGSDTSDSLADWLTPEGAFSPSGFAPLNVTCGISSNIASSLDLSGGMPVTKITSAGTYTITSNDCGTAIHVNVFSNNSISLPDPATLWDGFFFDVRSNAGGIWSLNPINSTINLATVEYLPKYRNGRVYTDGTDWFMTGSSNQEPLNATVLTKYGFQAGLAWENTQLEGTALGYQSLTKSTGTGNTAVGFLSNQGLVAGDYNTSIGHTAGKNITAGSNNTFIGALAAFAGPVDNRVSVDNIIWGDNSTKSVWVGGGTLATTATSGFLYIPNTAGTPTGTPETHTGWLPMVIDSTNHKLYFYSGGSWRDVGP